MSDFLDKAKAAAKDLTDKAKDTVSEHSDKIDDGIDKAAEFVNEKTKGKYTDKVETVQSKAHQVVEKLAEDGRKGGDGDDGAGGPA